MAKGRKTGGRLAGTPNKMTRNVRQALEIAFEQLGGVTALVDWGRDNPVEFYRLWAKLLPKELNVTEEVNQNHTIVYMADNGRDPDLVRPLMGQIKDSNN